MLLTHLGCALGPTCLLGWMAFMFFVMIISCFAEMFGLADA